MIYLTTGTIDRFDNPKIDLESMVAKAYSHEILQNCSDFAISLMNTAATTAGHAGGLNIRDAMQLQCNETCGKLKKYAGRIGLQHAMVLVHVLLCFSSLCLFFFLYNFLNKFLGSFWSQCKRLQRFDVA